MADLTTTYLGLRLRSPIVASASPLNAKPDTARRVEDAGASALVLPSLFEEEILHEEVELTRALETGSEVFAEAQDYFPHVATYADVGNRYLDRLEMIKTQSSIPVIASLNAGAPGAWARYARWLVDAGADALELNLYHVAADPTRSAADVEAADIETVAAVRAEVDIPLAVKLSPFYSATANVAARIVAAGADGLVLFNRFYQPDFDPETLEIVPHLELSRSAEVRLPMTWIALLYGRVPADFGLTGGVASAQDAIKALLAGARVVAMASELLRHGPERIGQIVGEIQQWLVEREYRSLFEMIGSLSQKKAADPSALMRANYMKVLHSWRG